MQASAHARRTTSLWLIAFTLCAITALVFPALSHAAKKHRHGGSAYTETNEPDNKVVVYARGADGSLTEIQRVDTGGAGVNGNPPFGQGFLDSIARATGGPFRSVSRPRRASRSPRLSGTVWATVTDISAPAA